MPVQVMTADQHPCRKSCDDHQRRRKKHNECYDECEEDDECDEDDDDCNPLTDEMYSLGDIVKIMKRLRNDKCDEHECNECECADPHDVCDECCPLDEVGCAYGPTDNCDLCYKPPSCQCDDFVDGCKKCMHPADELLDELLCD